MLRLSPGTIAKAVIGAILLVVVIWQVDGGKVWTLLKGTDPGLFALATLSAGIGLAGQAVRWAAIAAVLKPPLGLRNAMVGVFEGQLVNQVMPAMIGGDAVRALRAYDSGAEPGRAILGVILDRALGLLFVALIVVATFAVSHSPAVVSQPFKVIAVIAAFVVVGAGAMALLGPLIVSLGLPRWIAPLASVIDGFARVVRSPGAMVVMCGAMAVTTCGLAGSIALCAKAIGITLAPVDAIVVLTGMVIAGAVPLSIGGWGLREGAAVLLLTSAGVDAAAATSLAILFGLSLTALGLVGAVVWVLAGYRRFDRAAGLSKLRRAAAEVWP
jgi:uncharacterized membrane protein YbhN (UPF0104 family)